MYHLPLKPRSGDFASGSESSATQTRPDPTRYCICRYSGIRNRDTNPIRTNPFTGVGLRGCDRIPNFWSAAAEESTGKFFLTSSESKTTMEVEKATVEKQSNKKEEKEGSFLLGPPTFADLGNGRFKCKEAGHELPAKEKESYARSKACRLALIDAALANNKPPLNMFQQCPLLKSKLVCKLTGDTINKTEEHIWKHMSGKRFQNKLEQKEMEKVASPEKVEKKSKKSKKLPKSSIEAMEDDRKSKTDGNASLERNHTEKDGDDPEEPDFWTPPVGERWDFDDGKDRWESDTTSENGEEDGLDEGDEQCEIESMELSMRTKRMSLAVGPSSFASRKKKKKKTTSATHPNDSCDNV